MRSIWATDARNAIHMFQFFGENRSNLQIQPLAHVSRNRKIDFILTENEGYRLPVLYTLTKKIPPLWPSWEHILKHILNTMNNLISNLCDHTVPMWTTRDGLASSLGDRVVANLYNLQFRFLASGSRVFVTNLAISLTSFSMFWLNQDGVTIKSWTRTSRVRGSVRKYSNSAVVKSVFCLLVSHCEKKGRGLWSSEESNKFGDCGFGLREELIIHRNYPFNGPVFQRRLPLRITMPLQCLPVRYLKLMEGKIHATQTAIPPTWVPNSQPLYAATQPPHQSPPPPSLV